MLAHSIGTGLAAGVSVLASQAFGAEELQENTGLYTAITKMPSK